MQFQIEKVDQNSKARAGKISTGHGEIFTPIFMPVGTLGSVKGVHQTELKDDIKAQIILGNNYHLNLRPGLQVLHEAGGLHRFMHWDLPILTDSGGYQVFSLAANRKINSEGVTFRSHIDGSKLIFTPENVVDSQRIIGSDIMMALDECTPYPCEYKYAKESMELTHTWLARGHQHYLNTQPKYDFFQAYFPIVQGSVFKDLRVQSAETIARFATNGCAIGGLSVGEPVEMMYEMIEIVEPVLPKDKPRYLMGVGTPVNILEAISRGIDMFDCVMPTRNGRNGMLFTKNGIINIKNEKWKSDFSPIDPEGTSFVDNYYSKAYLRHLIIAEERLAAQIASIHNLAFYIWLVTEARNRIISGDFNQWKDKMITQIAYRL
jgi:queuine tRNA-ribosyltransferase